MYRRVDYYGQAPAAAGCDRAELERRVNACVEQTRQCTIAAVTRVGRAMVTCRSPFCRARAMAQFWLEMRRCVARLQACDAAAKRDTRCA